MKYRKAETASERVRGVWLDKETGLEVHTSGALVGYLYSRPDRFERVVRVEEETEVR